MDYITSHCNVFEVEEVDQNSSVDSVSDVIEGMSGPLHLDVLD